MTADSALIAAERDAQQDAHAHGTHSGYTRVPGVGWVNDDRNPPDRGELP